MKKGQNPSPFFKQKRKTKTTPLPQKLLHKELILTYTSTLLKNAVYIDLGKYYEEFVSK